MVWHTHKYDDRPNKRQHVPRACLSSLGKCMAGVHPFACDQSVPCCSIVRSDCTHHDLALDEVVVLLVGFSFDDLNGHTGLHGRKQGYKQRTTREEVCVTTLQPDSSVQDSNSIQS